jgi:hypothetical protein
MSFARNTWEETDRPQGILADPNEAYCHAPTPSLRALGLRERALEAIGGLDGEDDNQDLLGSVVLAAAALMYPETWRETVDEALGADEREALALKWGFARPSGDIERRGRVIR